MQNPTFLFAALLAAHLAAQEPPRAEAKEQETQAIVLSVSGMTRPSGCPPAVRKALLSLPWVRDAKVEYSTQTASVMVVKSSQGLGYKVERIEPSAKTVEDEATAGPSKAPIPRDAPGFFVDAMIRASTHRRPVVIDFWAEWCAPCKALEDKTMADPEIAKALEGVEVVFVDLDLHPELAKAYGVTGIADVFFVDREGVIVDRLRKYEPPAPFRKRLDKLVRKPTTREPK